MFASREDMSMGTSFLHTHLQRFVMFMHVRSHATETSEVSIPKTEAVYFPNGSTIACEIQSNCANFDHICDSRGFITFNDKFCYFGTIISSDLRDCQDIDRRINQASRAFGSLSSIIFLNQKLLSPIIQYHLFMAIAMHRLLFVCLFVR